MFAIGLKRFTMLLELEDKEIQEIALKIVREGPICDHCLGRQFAKISTGLSNARRGEMSRAILKGKGVELEEGKCWVCNGLFEKIEVWVSKALETLREYEFRSFLVGTKVDGLLLENEDLLWEIAGASYAEPLKAELNREVGKRIEQELEKIAEFKTPDLVLILNLWTEEVEVQANAIFIYGQYLKFKRGIPQTKWFCRSCRGRSGGCELCGYTGKIYPESVEELISSSLQEVFKSEDIVLHGCGREDIDARMLGSGRPFVVEIKAPRHRYVDLQMAEQKVNTENAGKVAVLGLQYVKKGLIAKLKSDDADKTYQGRVVLKTTDVVPVPVPVPVHEADVKIALETLCSNVIEQQTPGRVVHRRADLIRKRKVVTAQLVSFTTDASRHRAVAVIKIKCDAGLYIKELVSGDGGRTKPSLNELLGSMIEAEMTELDVLDVDLNIRVADFAVEFS